LGMKILVVSNSQYSLVPEIAAGITVDFEDFDGAIQTILAAIRPLSIRCVFATDDSCVEISSHIAQILKLPQNKPEAAALTHRKDLARQALKTGGCNTPEFQIIRLDMAEQHASSINYPVVIKPLALSASRGVIRADNEEQMISACSRIDKILAAIGQSGYIRDHILIESYLDGAEFAVEGFIIQGEFHLLTVFDKPEPLTGPYFEETYYLTPTQLDHRQQTELVNEVRQCCRAYGLEQGPVHAEARIGKSGVVLLELAARTIGGQCGQLIEFSLQQKLEEIVIQGMCGIKPELPSNPQAAGVMMIPVTDSGILKRFEGLTAAKKIKYIEDIEIHIPEGYELVPLPEGSSYLGFIFAKAPEYHQVYQSLRSAYECLRFVTQPVWQINQLH
jgi:biotin carboxylase